MYPLKLKPVYNKTIWGNNKLAKIRNEIHASGTSWEVSAHANADNVILNGIYKGLTLNHLLDKYPIEMLGDKKRSQILRLAYLDAKEALSIQVHPGDEYARKYDNDEGKTESWYILEADLGSTLVAGTITDDVDTIRQAIAEDTIENYVRKVPVSAGDFICIDSGELHALGKGILALEIGQNSDTTYRFYDYHRKDSNGVERQLHLKKCFDVVDFSLKSNKISIPQQSSQIKKLLERKEFAIDLIDFDSEYTLETNGKTFYCISNVGNPCDIIYKDEQMPLEFTENIFIPACCDNVKIIGKSRILISYVK